MTVEELAEKVREWIGNDGGLVEIEAPLFALDVLVALAEVGAEHAEEHADWRTMRAERAELREALGEIVGLKEEGLTDGHAYSEARDIARAALKIGEN